MFEYSTIILILLNLFIMRYNSKKFKFNNKLINLLIFIFLGILILIFYLNYSIILIYIFNYLKIKLKDLFPFF